MLHPLLLPKYPGRRASFHLYGSPTIHPLQLVSELPSLVGRPLELLSACLWLPCPLSVCPPPSAVFGLGPSPCQILGVIPPECPFISLPAFVTLPSTPPPAGLNRRPSPCRSQGVFVVLFFFVPYASTSPWCGCVMFCISLFSFWSGRIVLWPWLGWVWFLHHIIFSRNCLSLLMWWV